MKYMWGCRSRVILNYSLWKCKKEEPHWKTVSYKAKQNLTRQSSNHVPIDTVFWLNWRKHLYKILHMSIYGHFISNHKKLKPPRCPSLGKCIHNYVHLYNGILFPYKNKWNLKLKKTWRKLKCISLSKGSQTLKSILDSNYTIFWALQNYKDIKKIRDCQWLRE